MLHGRFEPSAVVTDGVRVAELAPDLDLRRCVRLESGRSLEQRDGIVDLVPAGRQLRRPTQPQDSSVSESRELGLFARPREVGVYRAHRLGVVVGEKRRVLVAAVLGESFEPSGEACVQTGSTRPRKTGVGDLARERMLDRVLALPGDRRCRAQANEVPFLERVEVRLTGDEFVDRSGPEHAADDRGRL